VRNIQQYFSVAFRGLGNAPFRESAKHHRKAENKSNAFLLLFSALRQPARSTSAQQKPVALLFVHPAFVTLRTGFQVFWRKMRVDIPGTKVAWFDYVPII
jgi:hypothetical protein